MRVWYVSQARGGPLELMAGHAHHAAHAAHAHHAARHALSAQRRAGVGVGVGGGVGVVGGARARPYVRHAARWPHHPIHHIHTQVRDVLFF